MCVICDCYGALIWRWDFIPSAGDGFVDMYHHYGVLCGCVVASSWQLVYRSLEFLHVEE